MLISLGGCGSDGTSAVTLGGGTHTEEKMTGVVYAPGGVLASAQSGWSPQFNFGFASAAYALQGVAPVGAGLPVSLVLLDSLDFSDGQIDSPKPLITAALTDDTGRYEIIDPAVEDVNICRKMLSVGGGDALTRALVFSHETQIDATSEALVRVLLEHVASSTAQLCDYNANDLTKLLAKLTDVTLNATGTTVAEINNDAYLRAHNNPVVQQMLVDLAN